MEWLAFDNSIKNQRLFHGCRCAFLSWALGINNISCVQLNWLWENVPLLMFFSNEIEILSVSQYSLTDFLRVRVFPICIKYLLVIYPLKLREHEHWASPSDTGIYTSDPDLVTHYHTGGLSKKKRNILRHERLGWIVCDLNPNILSYSVRMNVCWVSQPTYYHGIFYWGFAYLNWGVSFEIFTGVDAGLFVFMRL